MFVIYSFLLMRIIERATKKKPGAVVVSSDSSDMYDLK